MKYQCSVNKEEIITIQIIHTYKVLYVKMFTLLGLNMKYLWEFSNTLLLIVAKYKHRKMYVCAELVLGI